MRRWGAILPSPKVKEANLARHVSRGLRGNNNAERHDQALCHCRHHRRPVPRRGRLFQPRVQAEDDRRVHGEDGAAAGHGDRGDGQDARAGSTGCTRSARCIAIRGRRRGARSSAASSRTISSTAARTWRRARSSSSSTPRSRKRTSPSNKATLPQANLDFERQSKLVKTGARVPGGARSDHRQAGFRRGRRAEDGGDHRREEHHRHPLPAGSACAASRRGNM